MELVRYGPHPSQFAELTLPATGDRAPVAVVVHGGFWRARWDCSLGRPLAASLVTRRWAALNVEYRRVGDGGGYPATLDDVGAAVDALATVDGERLDLRRIVTIGHSAGGHLAAWSATRPTPRVAVTGVVAQAGVLDLRRAARERLGDGATQALLGGEPDEVPDRYAAASPIEHLPTGVPLRCVHGRGDDVVPLSQSEGFAAAAEAAGEHVDVAVVEGDHFVVIDPASVAWRTVLDWLDDW